MTISESQREQQLTETLAREGYWPAQASRELKLGRFSRVVELCKEGLRSDPDSISGRLIYATALYKADQFEDSCEEIYQLLSKDPDNLAALKLLGDAKVQIGDEIEGLACYRRVLEIDPDCQGIRSEISEHANQRFRTVTLQRSAESKIPILPTGRKIPFYTETIGDLFLAQGHLRIAAEVFRALSAENNSPRVNRKLKEIEQQVRDKESRHVDQSSE